MKIFITIIGIALLCLLLWVYLKPTDQTPGLANTGSSPSLTPSSIDSEAITADTEEEKEEQTASNRANSRFSGSTRANAGTASPSNDFNAAIIDKETYRNSTDLATLYQQLLTSENAEDYYYRYRILKECNDVRVRGIDAQLDTCEQIAEHTGKTLDANDSQGVTANITETCFAATERCAGFDFDEVVQTPAEALEEAIEKGSLNAYAANLYQISSDDPSDAREWLAAALNEQPDAELLRHAASFLRSSLRLRQEPFYGAETAQTVNQAERALDLTACRLEQGCAAGSQFMLERCAYLAGCLPWQSYEQWLFQTYNSTPDALNNVLALSQDYQQFLINGQAELLIFPDIVAANDG